MTVPTTSVFLAKLSCKEGPKPEDNLYGDIFDGQCKLPKSSLKVQAGALKAALAFQAYSQAKGDHFESLVVRRKPNV